MSREIIKDKFTILAPFLNEKAKRIWLATEAMALGYGGITVVSEATGFSRKTITKGCNELKSGEKIPDVDSARIRSEGAGRKKATESQPHLIDALEKLIDPATRGEPDSALRWTCKSTRVLERELKKQGFEVSHNLIAKLLKELGYSLQGNKKTQEGSNHPDRNEQFEYIHEKVASFQSRAQPVISVDAKKKENVGVFKNNGQEYQPKGNPEEVNVYDFMDKELGKVTPYGVYDMTANAGWVSVGVDHDTAAFAVESIRRWWLSMGSTLYPNASELLITADGGGSNGSRVRLWKVELQKLASELNLDISISHLPPGTSKWNKIEHRLFSYISQNWRGRPLISYEVIVNLISATKTQSGLYVKCELDTNKYPKGTKVSPSELNEVNLERDQFHGEWNYKILA